MKRELEKLKGQVRRGENIESEEEEEEYEEEESRSECEDG